MGIKSTNKVFLSIDDILPYIGEFGLFQKILNVIFIGLRLPVVYQVFIMYFSTVTPPWKCVTNSSLCTLNGTLSGDNNWRCHMPRNHWYYTESIDYSIVTQFNADCDDKWKVSLASSIYFVGWGVGAIFMGWLADKYGRKILIFPSLMTILLVGFISSFAPNIHLIIVCRFISGFLLPGSNIQQFVLVSELVGRQQRPLATVMLFFSIPIGMFVLALKAYFIKEWKILSIVCTAPYIFLILFYKFIPESVRWLLLQERSDEVMHIFRRIARWNKKVLPNDITVTPPDRIHVPKPNPLNLFRPRKIAIQSLVIGFLWLVTMMAYYGLNFAANDLGGSMYRDFTLLGLMEFPGNFVVIVFCNRFGRKSTSLTALVCAGVSCLAITLIPTNGSVKIARVIFGVAGKLFATITVGGIYIWTVEIYQTNIRAEAMGMCQLTAHFGSAIAPWIINGLKPFHNWLPFIVLGIAALIGFTIAMWLPETRVGVVMEHANVNQNAEKITDLPAEAEMKTVG